jgi:hypothetical protein
MLRLTRIPLALSVASLAAAMLAGCSGGGVSSGDVVAQVGRDTINKAAVNHWMATLAGGDYNELSGGNTVPEGLASEPPSYAACVAHLEAAAASSVNSGSRPTGVQLLNKCHQLYRALRTQATAYLVSALWQVDLDRAQGVTVTDGEVQQYFKQLQSSHPYLSTESRVRNYFASRKLNLSDFFFVLKLDLLSQKIQQKFGGPGDRRFAKLNEAEQQWTAKTSCRSGYVVQHCKQYKGEPEYSSSPPPSILMEQVAALATGRCINRPACARQ